MESRNGPNDYRPRLDADGGPVRAPWRPLLLLFIILALAISGVGLTVFLVEQQSITDQVYRLLSGTQANGRRQLENWRRNRAHDLRLITENQEYKTLLSRGTGRAQSQASWRPLVADLRKMLDSRYVSAAIFDSAGGVLAGVGAQLKGKDSFSDLARLAIKEGGTVFGDTVVDARDYSELRLLAVAPVVVEGRAVAAVGVQIEPASLNSMLPWWPDSKSSGELLLVTDRGPATYFLFPPKLWSEAKVLGIPHDAQVVSSKTGDRVRGRDYRGARALAVVSSLEGTPWKLVTKIDEREVYDAIREVALWVTTVALALVAGTGGLIFSWWRKEWADHLVQQYEAELRRRTLERHYGYLARYANDPIFLADADGRIIELNERAVEFYGFTRAELLRMRISDLSAPTYAINHVPLAELAYEHASVYEAVHRTRDGSHVPVEVSARSIRVEGRSFQQATVRDITERKRADERIRRLNRLYAALSQINAAVIRNRRRESLFAEICRIAVEEARFDFAWVGMLDKAGRLAPVAQYGRDEFASLLESLHSNPDLVLAAGNLEKALDEGEVVIENAMTGRTQAAQELLEKNEIHASAGLPLNVEGRSVGLVAVYSIQANVFDAEITRLLQELAEDVSFALETIAADERRERAERATRESEARYRHLFDHMSSGVIVYEAVEGGADFVFKDINHAVQRIERVRREHLIGKRLLELFPEAQPLGIFHAAHEVWRRGGSRHLPRLRISGRGWRELWFYALPNGQVVQVYDDVTERVEALDALRRSQERLALVLKGVNDGYWDINFETQEVYFSRRFAEMFGYELEELDSSIEGWEKLVHPDDRNEVQRSLLEHLEGRSPQFQSEHRMRRKDGSYIWVLARGRVGRRDKQGRPLRLAGTHTDITERKRYEEQLQLWATVFAGTGEAIFITDAQGRIVSANQSFTRITGYTEDEVLGKNPRILASGEHDRAFYQTLWAVLESTGHWQGEIRDRRKNGEVFPMWMAITALRDAQGSVRNYIAICSDISERKAAEERIRFLAQYDALTGLPNRSLLLDRLDVAIAHGQRLGVHTGVLFADIDRFKNVNDSLGHHFGDELLKMVGERLKAGLRTDDTVSRQGGDEFLLVLPELHEVADAAHVAQKMIDFVATPFVVDGSEIHITISVGIAVSPEDGTDGDTLIKNADAAMYYAKERGRNNYQFFIPELNRRAMTRITLENSLRRAVDRGDFVLHYQPQMNIETGELVGVEALLRWRREGRLVPPAGFISVAEDTGLILPIGAWVLHEACRQQRDWEKQGLSRIPVAVNISATQFRQKDVLPAIRSMVADSCVDPEGLEVELTESTIMEDAEANVSILRGLKDLGIGLAIDDFGTGYSSLNYLRRFPIDRLKVDQSFVHDLETNPADRAITEAIIALGKTLGLKVIAEGVEREGEIDLLRERHCDELQGFYLSPPLPPEELIKWWRRWLEGRNRI